MNKQIDDPTRPGGSNRDHQSADHGLANYEAEVSRQSGSDAEAVAGYTCLWVFLAVIVALSVMAGVFKW